MFEVGYTEEGTMAETWSLHHQIHKVFLIFLAYVENMGTRLELLHVWLLLIQTYGTSTLTYQYSNHSINI